MLNPLTHEQDIQARLEQHLVDCILTEPAQIQFKQGNIANRYLVKIADNVKELANQYVTEQPIHDLTQEHCEAYALYYLQINFIKVLRALQHCDFSNSKQIKLLDFGSGPGTACLATNYYLSKLSTITAIERSTKMQEIVKHLLPNTKVCSNLEQLDQTEKYDLIICANSLNELPMTQAETTLQILTKLLSDVGYILIIEPALKTVTQKTIQLRDWILEHSDLSIVYPCTHNKSCPMLKNYVNDWCHTEISWQPPKLVKQIDSLTGFNKHRLKTSVFIFSKKSYTASGFRVVNFPKKNKTGTELMLCGNDTIAIHTAKKADAKKVKNYSLLLAKAQA